MKERSKKIEIILKNFFLKLLILLFRVKNRDGRITLPENPRILFIRLNRLGDGLVTTPLIKLIKENLNPYILVLADSKNFVAFNSNKNIDKVIVYHKGIKSFFEIINFVKSQKIDLVIDAHDDVSFTVSLLVGCIRTKYKLALKKKNSPLFTHTVPKPDPKSVHVVDRVLAIAAALNLSYNRDEVNIDYNPPSIASHKSDNFIEKRFPEKKFLIGLNISAGSDARFWGVENFRKLEKWLYDNYDVHIIFICSTRDVKHAFQITVHQGNVFFTPDFDEFAAMIGKLDLLFSPDTATIHIASAFKVPVFGLYVKYNTEDMIWSPYRSDFDCVVTKEPNLNNLTFEEVISKLKPFLEKHIK